jgi:hypothetical protein
VLLVAAGFACLRPAWLGLVLAVASFGLSVRTVESCQPDCKIRHDDWRSATAYLESKERPGDAIVAYPREVRTPLDHYLTDTRPKLLYPERWSLVGDDSSRQSELAAAIEGARHVERIWLVTWWLPAEPAREALSSRFALVSGADFAGNVRVELYEPAARGR